MSTVPLSTVAILCCLAALAETVTAQNPAPPTSVPLEATFTPVLPPTEGPCAIESAEAFSNFRLLLDYDAPAGSRARLAFAGGQEVALPSGDGLTVEVAYEHLESMPARARIWLDPAAVPTIVDFPGSIVTGDGWGTPVIDATKDLRFDGDFTAMARFMTDGNGTLIAKAMPKGKWVENAKALYIHGGRLVYDIGWLGAMKGRTKVSDGKEHVAVLVVANGHARLFVDGKLDAERRDFTRPDADRFVVKLGSAASNFGGDFTGALRNVRIWKRALGGKEIARLSNDRETEVNTPDFHWKPAAAGTSPSLTSFGTVPGYATRVQLLAGEGFRLRSARIQPLATADHSQLVRDWNEYTTKRGKEIYHQLCVTCHGTVDQPGSLPTAPRFHEAAFHNGDDPYRLFQTLQKGYGMMVPQPQYTTAQKYDVIHYLREEFLKQHNERHLVAVDDAYLRQLPRGMSLVQEDRKKARKVPQYLLQDFGDTLMWTLQVAPGNIAQKGIAIRLDKGPGGITRGRAWALYDHDTMRLAAVWTGDRFVDWRGIAFDGSHGTHTSIVGEKLFVFPNEPAWANPATGKFQDTRILGRDGKPYGPLPREWVHFKSLAHHGDKAVISYTVGDRLIREIPSLGATGELLRRMEIAPSKTPITIRLSDAVTHVIPPSDHPQTRTISYAEDTPTVVGGAGPDFTLDLEFMNTRRFPGTVTTEIVPGTGDGGYQIDVLTHPAPDRNPWQSWMRTTGFDFFDDGRSAAVCTWNGDVWIVDGIDQSEGELRWQRICAGLFQPLGLRIRDGEIFVACRDMIARLVDLNGDREIDVIENFNNDHQVTEHFHEFAMGLQTDDEGNFYYAKSARHAKVAVVPHHGTVLRVSRDGSRTDILATGFRAANGICLNPDGSFIVTDQEGHWNPKNRINWVAGEGPGDFYGNMYGYHDITDDSDEAMNPPLCWITNSFDRSPAELLWVPENSAWTSLRGSLLSLSYGYGQIYVVPHENVDGQVQGGMCALPFDRFPTGIMRGRFHPGDGQLYACGMYAWAGNQRQPGGFYRIRATGKPDHLPVGLTTSGGTVTITFTNPLDRKTAESPDAWKIEAWDLRRTKNYGSKHYNQREWKVSSSSLGPDGRTVTLTVPELAPTWGMSIQCRLKRSDGGEFQRLIHNSIFNLRE